MQKTKKKSIQGITLVSLVITIIIMLILAGVAINLTIDSNGLFGKANTAGNKWNNSVENERSELQDLLGMVDVINLGWDINKIGSIVTETSEITGTTKERIVPIPKGYVASKISTEATIAGGLVIYEGTEPVTGEKNSIVHITAMKTRNQYVWIPVDDINYMVMCKSNNKLADASGNKTCNLELIDGILQCTNTAHSATAIELCGRLYGTNATTTDEEAPYIYTTNMQFTEAKRESQTWSASGYREPDIVSVYDKDDSDSTTYMAMAGITSGKVADFQKQLTDDFAAMATSVAKYGGFYVSRYEAGENGASKKNQKVITTTSGSAGNYIGVDNWYGLYGALHREIEVGTSTIQSHMIYGSQYDQIINFIGTKAQTGHPGEVVTVQSLTGTKETDELKNIYDLEGNSVEWTSQAYSDYCRSVRGGRCSNADRGYFSPASSLGNASAIETSVSCTSRATLYL